MTGTGRRVLLAGLATALAAVGAWSLGVATSRTATGVAMTAVTAGFTLWCADRIDPLRTRGASDEDELAQLLLRRREPRRLPDPPELEDMRRLVVLALGSAGDAHDRLRPVLREITAARAQALLGTRLDDEEGLEQLDPLLAAWVGDRARPPDRFARGIPHEELDSLLTALEGLEELTEEDLRWTTD